MTIIRPFQPADWGFLLDLANQAVPFAPKENTEWLKHRKAFDESAHTRRHYIVLHNDLPVGYGCLEQQDDAPAPEKLRIYVVCAPANLRGDVGSQLYARLLSDAKELRVAHLWAREFQADESARDFFTSHGFVEARRFTLPDQPPMVIFQLDL